MAKQSIEEVLKKFAGDIHEFVATSVVRLEDGTFISGYSSNENFDVSVGSAAYAEVVKNNEMAINMLGRDFVGDTEDILITTENAYLLFRMLGKKHYLGLAITRKGNLALSRIIMKKYEPFLLEALKELGEV